VKEGDLVAGRYRLLRPIGAGAMGTVWAARHELLGRDLALKMASASDRGEWERREARDLFLREVRIVGRLRHPNLIEIADAGEAGYDGLYLAMELLEGESLAQRIAAGPMTPAAALAVVAAVCCGLAAAHAAGVVHRDLKPENIFLARTQTGSVVPKLLDFGVSSARGVTTLHREKLFGTPAYMSPEQALGEGGTDHRTDLWALGVVLYEMLTGHLPFLASSYPALLPLIIEAPYPPLPASIPADVRTVVAGCLAKDRSDRYATAGALLEAIERALAALPATDRATAAGVLVETSRTLVSTVPGVATEPRPAATMRTARFWLALSIFTVSVAVGIAAIAREIRAPRAVAASAIASEAPPAPSPVPSTPILPTTKPPATGAGASDTAVTPPATRPPAEGRHDEGSALKPPEEDFHDWSYHESAAARAASARPEASAKAPRRHDPRVKPLAPVELAPRSPVTNVNNAGF
jgi:hypothetical protein